VGERLPSPPAQSEAGGGSSRASGAEGDGQLCEGSQSHYLLLALLPDQVQAEQEGEEQGGFWSSRGWFMLSHLMEQSGVSHAHPPPGREPDALVDAVRRSQAEPGTIRLRLALPTSHMYGTRNA
jgi:hypothetical protein